MIIEEEIMTRVSSGSSQDPYDFGPSPSELRPAVSEMDLLREFRGQNSSVASYDDVFIIDDSFEETTSSNNLNDSDDCLTKEELERAFVFADSFNVEKTPKLATSTASKPEIEIIELELPQPVNNSPPKEVNEKPRGKPIKCLYDAVDDDPKLNRQIEKIKNLGELTEEQIYYMVLKDINYYILIISGNCEHSWRHTEFKKYGKKSGNLLYENSAMISYREEQYMSAVRALQFVFCKKNHDLDEYIVKVLLPEALVKICMQVYKCSKAAAEDYLRFDHKKTKFRQCPKDRETRV